MSVHVLKPPSGSRAIQKQRRSKTNLETRKLRLVRGNLGLQCNTAFAQHSIAHSCREIMRALYRAGYDVAINADNADPAGHGWGGTSVRHLIGIPRGPRALFLWDVINDQLAKGEDGSAVVAYEVPDSYHWADADKVKRLNVATDLMLVPTAEARETFMEAGVTVPIEVVPLGVDRTMYRACERDLELLAEAKWTHGVPGPDTTVFLVAGYIQPRKGLDVAIAAFREAFPPDADVALLVKNVSTHWGEEQGRPVKEAQLAGYSVGLLEGTISEPRMARLIGSCDALVSSHRREGFGLLPLQALSCRTNVIATNYDGPATYISRQSAILIDPGTLYHPDEQYVPTEDLWANPSIHEVAEAMRQVARERGTQAESVRLDAGEQTSMAYGWEDTAYAFADAFGEHLGELRKRHAERPLIRPDSVSVLVPCRNGQADLERLGASLQGASLKVWDDASDTPLRDPVEHIPCEIMGSNAWIGEGAARDRLLREADTEFVLMTDADVEFVDPRWADVLRERLGSRRNVLLTPLMMLPDGRVWSAGGCYHVYGTQPLPAWHIGMGAHVDEETLAALDGTACTYAPGAAWFARREDLLAVWDWIGGYYPTVFTDVDLCFWLRAHGWRIETCTATRMVHHCGSYTERQTDMGAQAERFREHGATFISWWADHIEDDLARGAVLL